MIHRILFIAAALLAALPAHAEPDAASLRLSLETQAAQIRILEQAVTKLHATSAALQQKIASGAQAPAFAALTTRLSDGTKRLETAVKTMNDAAKRVERIGHEGGDVTFPVATDPNDKSGWTLAAGSILWRGEDGRPGNELRLTSLPQVAVEARQNAGSLKGWADQNAAAEAKLDAIVNPMPVRLASLEMLLPSAAQIEAAYSELNRKTSYIGFDGQRTVMRNGLTVMTSKYLGPGDGYSHATWRFSSGGGLIKEWSWKAASGTSWTIGWNGTSTGLHH